MKNSPEHRKNTEQDISSFRFQADVETLHRDALRSESFEEVSESLSELEKLQKFRKQLQSEPFADFHKLIETATIIDKMPLAPEIKKKRLSDLTEKMASNAIGLSPRVADLYQAMLSTLSGQEYETKFDITGDKIEDMQKNGDLSALYSGDISWDIKYNRITTRLTDFLAGARALDRRDGHKMDEKTKKWRQKQLKNAPTKPPSRRNESRPGVDAMDRLKEGEKAPAIWTIHPAWGGYYKEQSFSAWDATRNVWTEPEYKYKKAKTIPLSKNTNSRLGPIDFDITADVMAGSWVSLPIPYTHDLHKVDVSNFPLSIMQDQNGDLVVYAEGEGEGEVKIKVSLAPAPTKKFYQPKDKIVISNFKDEFCTETMVELENIRQTKKGNMARARAICSYVRRRVRYLAPKDQTEAEHYNQSYRDHPKGFAGAVDELKVADCDVANTYFASLCAQLRIPVRHCVGHSVSGQDKSGNTSIHSGTGHGWSEVYDGINREWIRMDATPPGDPNLEQDEQDKQKGQFTPGDYGGEEAVRPSDEQLEKLHQKLLERKTELSYTKQERALAESAGVELSLARQIVKEINQAENTRLPNGEKVVDALSRLFNAIVESRRTPAIAYDGPVNKKEGGESIQNIVRHKIGIIAGESDPVSREKPAMEIVEEKNIGGFDLYIIGDKSGSMSSTSEGESLWRMQRRCEYLIFSSLHRFHNNIKRAGLMHEKNLTIRTQGISFRGDDPNKDIDLDKPLSPNFSANDKVKLWHSLTQVGGGNGDVAALASIYEQVKQEHESNIKKGLKDNRLKLVIACSDGGYVGDEDQMQLLAKKLNELDTVVVGIGLTESAANAPVVMDNPPYSHGTIVHNINDLPAVVAKYVVMEATKLFPDKAVQNSQQIIDQTVKKFINI